MFKQTDTLIIKKTEQKAGIEMYSIETDILLKQKCTKTKLHSIHTYKMGRIHQKRSPYPHHYKTSHTHSVFYIQPHTAHTGTNYTTL